jgi:hypothetical protein
MSQVSPILRKTSRGYCHWCPGCGYAHTIWTDGGAGPQWTFNGDVNAPTFSPSVRHFVPARTNRYGVQFPEKTFCHYFITAGQIAFCGDCEHAFSGQTVPLPVMPAESDYRYPP